MSELVQSVVRSFDLVRALAANSDSLALGELAAQAGLPKSTTRRLLATLESVGAVARGVEPGTYVSGAVPGLTDGGPSPGLHAVAPVFVRDAVALTGEATTLAVLDQGTVIFTEQANGPNPITVPESTGMRFKPHTLSSGLALMSGWPDDKVEEYLSAAAGPGGADRQDIIAKIESARLNGYLWHLDRWIEGISAVAAPVYDSAGHVVAALGSFGPSYRFPGSRPLEETGLDLARTARQLRAHL